MTLWNTCFCACLICYIVFRHLGDILFGKFILNVCSAQYLIQQVCFYYSLIIDNCMCSNQDESR